MSSEPRLPDLSEARQRHLDNKAPDGARAAAVARFTASQPRSRHLPAWGLAAAAVCAVLLIPGVVRDSNGREDGPAPGEQSDGNYGVASLSLNQLELPPRPDLQSLRRLSSSQLSATTNLPLGIPNLSQLSVTRIEDKETM